MNGDGYPDAIVGAYLNDAGGLNAGRAYVYFGGPVANTVADLTVTGAAADDRFGVSVSGAGDVNGDGYADDAGGSDAGRAYVYYGGPAADSVADLIVTGAAAGDLGAEPANVWLSLHGGKTYDALKTGVGGAASNAVALRVPHAPTKFAKLKVAPADVSLAGSDDSDSLFTIQTSVSLLAMLAAPLPQGGALISWSTDPGPEDLAGYRLERSGVGSSAWHTLVALTQETSVADPVGGPGVRYRLFAVNGFGEALWLGEASIRPLAPISAWPLPYRGGELTVSFATYGGLGGGAGAAELLLYDVQGRLVRTIARGNYTAGYESAVWDGRDDRGRVARVGVYFLQSRSAGQTERIKITVLH